MLRREHLRGRLDRTEAAQAVEDLEVWPGERSGHRLLLARAWQLRDTVRGWDAMYVALAEALDAVLLTTDRRLAARRCLLHARLASVPTLRKGRQKG